MGGVSLAAISTYKSIQLYEILYINDSEVDELPLLRFSFPLNKINNNSYLTTFCTCPPLCFY